MSEATGPAKSLNLITPESQIKDRAEPTPDVDATLDASGSTSFPVGRSSPESKSIGPYRLLRRLGEGGMGQVWLAEQTTPVRRQVALKLIRAGMYDDSVVQRFQSEQQSLAVMNHPAIAKVFDAGSTADGQPYFVMEYVDGPSITRYCDRKTLKVRERLELFIKMCEGVQHAHQQAIIHRDLKPSNVLVMEVDGKPVPRIIDFGIAKAISSQPIAEQTMFTRVGALVGTPGFMSPEQADPNVLDVDTRTDVYSLGVILYALLTGMLPFEPEEWKKKPFDEVLRQLREEDPPSPSTKLGIEKETAAAAAETRGTEPKQLVRALQGDLDWITMKALEKDRARRYASAAGLAADIHRYLRDEPIMARPPSTSYQMQKFARRHSALVAGVAAVFVVLVGGIVASTWQAMRASRAGQAALVERDRAAVAEQTATQQRDRALSAEQAATNERNKAVAAEEQSVQERNRALAEKQRADGESATAKAVNDFLLNDLLAQASASTQAGPNTKPDPDLKVRTALDRAAAQIAGKFQKQPLVEASIRQTIGNTYQDLGLYPDAQRELEQALDLRRRLLGGTHPATLSSMTDLAALYQAQGKYPQAEALYIKILEVHRRVRGEEHPDTLRDLSNLAALYQVQGKYPQAEVLFTKLLNVQRRLLGEEHPNTLAATNNLAALYLHQGKYAQAESLLTKVVEVLRRTLGEEHPDTLLAMTNLGIAYYGRGRYAQAEGLFTKVLEVQRRVLGEEHPDTLRTMNNLGGVYYSQGKYGQAEALYTKLLEIQGHVLGEEHPSTLSSMNNLGSLYYSQGKYGQAEALYTKLLEIQRRVLGEEHPETLGSVSNLGSVYYSQGKYAQAEALYAKLLEVQRRVQGEEHPDTLNSMDGLAVVYQGQGKYAQAEDLYTKILDARRRVQGEEHPDMLSSMNGLANLYRSQGKFAQAEALFSKVLDVQRRVLGGEHPYTLSSMDGLAELYQSQGKFGDAEALFSKTLEARRRVLGPEHPNTIDDLASLGWVRLQQQNYAEAEPLLRSALSSYERTLPDSWEHYHTQSMLGTSLAGQKEYAEAEPLLTSGFQGMIQREATIPWERRPVLAQGGEWLVKLYQDWKKPEKAAEWMQKLQETKPSVAPGH